MVSGSITKPELIVIELIDLFLVDIGSTGFTNTEYSDSGPDLTQFYEDNPHLMEDGIRTAFMHSHHNMGVFFSGEDVDDLVVNTKNKEVDYYVSLIVNNRGDWESRIAFRIEEEVVENVKTSLWSSVADSFNHESSRNYKRSVLIQIPLALERKGTPEVFFERKKFLEDKEKRAAKARQDAAIKKYIPNSFPQYGQKRGEEWNRQYGEELFHEKEEEDIEKDHQILMARILAYSLTENNSLTAVLDMTLKRLTPMGEVSDLQLDYIVGRIIEEAPKIISHFEGGWSSDKYNQSCLRDLVDELMTFVDPKGSDEDPLQQLIGALDAQLEMTENEPVK